MATPNQIAKREIEERRIQKSWIALVVKKTPAHFSEMLAGKRKMPDDVIRGLNFTFAFLDSKQGRFVFNQAGVKFLRRGIADMEKSAVRSDRPNPKPAPPLPAPPAERA